MKKLLIAALFSMVAFAGTATAQRQAMDDYMMVGTVDGVYPEENRIVINDVPYRISDSLVVHTNSARNVSMARLRVGVKVGIRFGQSEPLSELWILPRSYKDPRR